MPLIANIESIVKAIKAKGIKKADGTITSRYKATVKGMLHDLAANTPQWSGDLAASWQVMVGAKNQLPTHQETPFKQEEWQEIPADQRRFIGHPDAVGYAMDQNAEAINRIRWNSIVSIQNANPTGQVITQEELRQGNFIPGDIMAVKYVQLKYSSGFTRYRGPGIVEARTGEIV